MAARRRNPWFIPAWLYWLGLGVLTAGTTAAGVYAYEKRKQEQGAAEELEAKKALEKAGSYAGLAALAVGIGVLAIGQGAAPARPY